MPVRPRLPLVAALAPCLAVLCLADGQNRHQDVAAPRASRRAFLSEQAEAAAPRALEQTASSSLFCFCLVVPFGYEASLLAAQHKEGVGVFGCNDHLVFSNVSGSELFGAEAESMNTAVIKGPLRALRGNGPNKAYLNGGAFMKVWRALFLDGRFEKYDWTLKVEVDTIVVPALLRGLLLIHCEPQDCRPMYLRDSNSSMHGPIEVVSRAGMKYFAKYEAACEKKLDATGMNEAQFFSKCLDSLAILAEPEPNLLLQVASGHDRKPCDNMHAAFHPFKSWDLSLQCLEQAGLRMFRRAPRRSPAARGPSLFCFASVQPSSYETMLVAQQFLAGVGIFACDDYMLFSNVSSKDLFRQGFRPSRWPGIGPTVSVIDANMEVQRSSKYFTPLNSGIFIKAWRRIFKDGLYKEADWTLKLDADAVFLPGRLRELLWSACPLSHGRCGALYVEDPGRHMSGPVEALSREAVETFSRGADGCEQSIDHSDVGENRYVSDCLRQLKIPALQLPELLSEADPITLTKPECRIRHAVYHPFKLWDDYMGCMAEAGYILPGPAGERDRWSLASSGTRWPTMFCWALVLPSGPEPALLLRERQEGVGIFSCDAHLIISNASLTMAFGEETHGLKQAVIDISLFSPRGGKYYTVLNSPVFIKAWHAVFEDGRFRNYDWTFKLDADAVFVPDRVRSLLSRHCDEKSRDCSAKYLANFGGDLHGPVEALSRGAAELYAEHEERCRTEVDYSDKGEDWYLDLCMELLGVPGEEEPSLLSDWHLDRGYPSACDTMHATFHPFKTWDYYYRCLCESGYGTAACTQLLAPTTTTTFTTVTFTATTTTGTTTTRTTVATIAPTSRPAESGRTRDHLGVIVVEGRGQAAHDGGAASRSKPGDLMRLVPRSLRSNTLALLFVVCSGGLLVGAGLGGLVSFVRRKLRARRIEALAATPVPGSPSQAGLHQAGSTERLLRPGGEASTPRTSL